MANSTKTQPPLASVSLEILFRIYCLEEEYANSMGISTSTPPLNSDINTATKKSLSNPDPETDSGKEIVMAGKKKDKYKGEPPLPGFSFRENVNQMLKEYREVGEALDGMMEIGPVQYEMESEFELSHEIAIALKQELRTLGISRESFCDKVNDFLGRTPERYKHAPRLCRKPLTKDILDKMISDPVKYPLHSYYLFAFQHVFNGFGIINAIIGAKGARVVSGEDLRKILLIKAQEFRQKAQELEKSLGRI